VDAQARIRQIADTVRNAPGLLNILCYGSREPNTHYLLLTTWENGDWWQKGQERFSPYHLLLASSMGMFAPEQWLLRHIWGYSRPQARPELADIHLILLRWPDRADHLQQELLAHLQQQAREPLLSFALLARSLPETPKSGPLLTPEHSPGDTGPVFLNLLSWPGETTREDFVTSDQYLSMQGLLHTQGLVRSLRLYPF
jgi:hypothetical protein